MRCRAALLFAVLIAQLSSSSARADVFDHLRSKDFSAAIRSAKSDLEKVSREQTAERVQALRNLILAQLSEEHDGRTRDALDLLDEEASDAWTQADWYAGIELEAIQLARSDSGAVARSRAFRRFERLAWIGGADSVRAGSTLCGVAIGLSALGWEEPARRIYAAASARLPRAEAAFRAACVLDRVAYSTGTWGMISANQDRINALRAILSHYPGGLAPAAAEYIAGQKRKDALLLALPEQARVAQISARMQALPEVRDELFLDLGDGVVFPRGYMALVPGCRTADSSGIGVVLLKRGKGEEEDGIVVDAKGAPALAQRMGDALARVELARRGVLVSGASIKRSGTRSAEVVRWIRNAGPLRRLLPESVRDLIELSDAATARLGDLSRWKVSRPASPESLMSNPAFRTLFEVGGKSILSLADKTLAKEIYVNPRIPYMDWGAREMDLGCGYVYQDKGAERAWSTSEYWRAANLKKYVALNSIARNSVGMSDEERTVVRRQMTTYWECVVADVRVHVAEHTLEGLPAHSIEHGLTELYTRESRALRRLEEVRKISDTPQLRQYRETFLTNDLARASAAKEEELGQVFPPGTLLITLSTTVTSTTVIAGMIEGGDRKPLWHGYRLPIGREDLAARAGRIRELLETWAPESEVLEAGGGLFDSLLGQPPVTGWLASCKRVVISPNGPAGDIPFNALAWQAESGRQFLSLSKPISIIESVALLKLRQRGGSDGATRAVSVIASPASKPLLEPITELEVAPPSGLTESSKDLASLYGSAVVEGPQATESRVRQALVSDSMLHVATHGFTPPDTLTRAPLTAGFWAAPDPDSGGPASDGVMQAWEVVTQLSSKADLVVLSSCETGALWTQMGTIGELARALLYAGVGTVVVSQWRVPERETQDLMLSFHRNLLAGKAKDEALMLAMQSLRGTTRGVPGFWAGFRCVGSGW